MRKDSWSYQLIREWIVQGAQWDKGSGDLKSIAMDPPEYAFKKATAEFPEPIPVPGQRRPPREEAGVNCDASPRRIVCRVRQGPVVLVRIEVQAKRLDRPGSRLR